MSRVVKLLTLGVVMSLLAALAVVPVAAQDAGGVIIEGNAGGDVATMNPILSSDVSSQRVIALTNVGILGVNPETGAIEQNQPGALAETWDVSEDGSVYTFHLREDLVWSDGTPVTAADVMYSWEAIKAGAAGTIDVPASYVYDPAGGTGILDVQAPDEYTLVVTFASPECTALNYAGSLVPVPAHVMPADVAELMDADYNLNPTVTSGVFNFSEFRPGEQVSLVKNPTYIDALDGEVKPDGYIYKNVPDATVLTEQFLAGETNLIDNPLEARRNDIRATDSQVYDYPGNRWTYFAMNLADPSNPQNAFDEAGNPIDQGYHPFFGDINVRQALARGIDVNAIATTSTQGEGTPMATFLIPASWAFDSGIAPIAYDPEAASQMLTDAGWIDDDNDPSTPRVAQGAPYAPDGTLAEFTLYTNDSNPVRVAAGTLIQDELSQIGVKVDFQAIDFNTLLDIMDSQTFDAIILGWRNGYPDDPDATQLFTASSDVIGAGSNFTSWNSAEFTDLNNQAKNVPGCDPAERTPIYSQMQQVFQQELPYITLFAQNGMYAAGANVAGFDPRPSNLLWNVDAWSVSTP